MVKMDVRNGIFEFISIVWLENLRFKLYFLLFRRESGRVDLFFW